MQNWGKARFKSKVMDKFTVPPGFQDMLSFGLVEALLGRRSRRFFMGAEIADGVFACKSKHQLMPLSELEKMLVVTACGGNTGWHHLIYRAQRYVPHLSNYAGAAGGRTFPSSAGFHTSKTFFTDDTGVYVLDNRDAPAPEYRENAGKNDLAELLLSLNQHVTKIQDGRLKLPSEVPFVEAHNTWVTNKPGTLLVIPVGDLAQHVLLALCYMLQNGQVLYDDINKCPIPGIEKYSHLVDVTNVLPLTFADQLCMSELSVEMGASCYAGALMLQAMGLGGWMYDGIDPFGLLGASGKPEVPGLGFRFDMKEGWSLPNVTGLPGIMEGFCPPHYPDMRAAVEAVCERKFGMGGPFNPETPGPWKDSEKVRSSAQVHSEEFRECVALQAQYIYDTFGKFPATVPSIFTTIYLQAHHLDLDHYDEFYKPGEYLHTHANHMERWHPGEGV
jgi:hypothetical protein